MTIVTEAAVAVAPNAPFEIQKLTVDEPRDDEAQVKIVASGVCNTDNHIRNQVYDTPQPAVLGHEGAGIVEKVGKDIRGIEPGDKVVLGWDSCGYCRQCQRAKPSYCENYFQHLYKGCRLDGTTAFANEEGSVASHFFGQSSFARITNVKAKCLVKLHRDMPLELAAPLGCGQLTGAGAATSSTAVKPGETVAVFGTGGVGLAAIMAARAVGAAEVVAVDIHDKRLETAKEVGATSTINSRASTVGAQLEKAIGPSGVDVILDTTGIPAVINEFPSFIAPLGRIGLIAVTKPGTKVSFDVGTTLAKGWTVRTISGGDVVPADMIRTMIDWWSQGKFPVEKFIQAFPLNCINDAFDAAASGEVIKPVILM